MLKNSVVQVSGRGANVDFIIDDVAPFDEVTKGLRGYLVEKQGLWSGGAITVNVGRRLTSREQLKELQNIIERESGLTVIRFSCSPVTLDSMPPGDTGVGAVVPPPPAVSGTQHNAAVAPPPTQPVNGSPQPIKSGLPKMDPVASQEPRRPKRATSSQRLRETALIIKTTCHSGAIVRHQGDVVVLGDVNPGAEVYAGGDVAVFGCLRGFAHAGTDGDTKATIVALGLDSPRIQIGPHVGISSEAGQQSKSTDTGPMIAYVWRRSIHVAPFTGRFAKYGKGELYDR